MSLMANESGICSWCCSIPTNPFALVVLLLLLLLNGFSGNGIYHSDKSYTFCDEKHTKRCITIWKNANIWLNKQKNVSIHARRSGLIRRFIQFSMGECIIILNKYPLPRKKDTRLQQKLQPTPVSAKKRLQKQSPKRKSNQTAINQRQWPVYRAIGFRWTRKRKSFTVNLSCSWPHWHSVYREGNSGKRFFSSFVHVVSYFSTNKARLGRN